MLTKKKICVDPSDNSIANTAIKVLTPEFEISNDDPDRMLLCSDDLISYDKSDTEYYFGKKHYYPKPKQNSLCIKKPVDGSGSKGITFDLYKHDNDDFVYQKFIYGDEYSVDGWYYDGQLKNFAVRKRSKIWNGISMHSEFTNEFDDEIQDMLNEIISIFTQKDIEHGLFVIQFIRDASGKFWLIEINPRPCANMCYGDDANYILNYIRASFGMEYNVEKIKLKEINRFLGWVIK